MQLRGIQRAGHRGRRIGGARRGLVDCESHHCDTTDHVERGVPTFHASRMVAEPEANSQPRQRSSAARRRMSSNETNTCTRTRSLWTNVKTSWKLGGPILAERNRLGYHREQWRLHLLACLSISECLSMGCWAGVPRRLRQFIPTAELYRGILGILPHSRSCSRGPSRILVYATVFARSTTRMQYSRAIRPTDRTSQNFSLKRARIANIHLV